MTAIQFELPVTLYDGPNETGELGEIFATPPRRSRFSWQISVDIAPEGDFDVRLLTSIDGVNFYPGSFASPADFMDGLVYILVAEFAGGERFIRFEVTNQGTGPTIINSIINFVKYDSI